MRMNWNCRLHFCEASLGTYISEGHVVVRTVWERAQALGVIASCVATTSCGDGAVPTLDQIDIFAPGLEISVQQNGAGQYHQILERKTGHFDIGREGFVKLQTQTEPFRISDDSMSAKEVSNYIASGQRCEGNYATDQGGISLHWKGESVDQFYAVDYGCDGQRHAARNKVLQGILASMPVPHPDILP
ncbi:hypothetical protein [Sphingobium yanoikuyae]|uniref:hypothetical protein n=1 Tax=Sphingobium yanoikuyae TaxID=13690 RepID=UPI0026F190A4|nr:hypothetical protein [Sphingobium yanoikuyae]